MRKLLFALMVLILLAGCGKKEKPNIVDSFAGDNAEVEIPLTVVDSSVAETADELDIDYYTGEIDVYHLLDYMDLLVKHVNQPAATKHDIGQIDLFYFLIDYTSPIAYDFIEFGYEAPEGWRHAVSYDALADALYTSFGIDEKCLNLYKNSAYEFQTSYDFYDADTDEFKYKIGHSGEGAVWHYGSHCSFSRENVSINIDGYKITVKIAITEPGGAIKSADYSFIPHTKNGNVYYLLTSVDVYSDERNVDTDIFLSLDGAEFPAPWFVVDNNGEFEYYSTWKEITWVESDSEYPPSYVSGFREAWDSAYEDAGIEIICMGIKNDIAYVVVNYYAVLDTYVYDIRKETGYWMSGAVDLEDFYEKELAHIRSEWASGEWVHYYRNYHILLPLQDHDYAVMLRRVSGGLEGEYLLRNLTTGEEIFICESYTTNMDMHSGHEEGVRWISEGNLLLDVLVTQAPPYDPNRDGDYNGNWATYTHYSATYDGQNWSIIEVVY